MADLSMPDLINGLIVIVGTPLSNMEFLGLHLVTDAGNNRTYNSAVELCEELVYRLAPRLRNLVIFSQDGRDCELARLVGDAVDEKLSMEK